jgi:hypothetical protein
LIFGPKILKFKSSVDKINLWLKTTGIGIQDSKIYLNKYILLKTVVDANNKIITAEFPKKLISKSSLYKIYIKGIEDSDISNAVVFRKG